jgi:adenylyltransferase/sulfurtransferase
MIDLPLRTLKYLGNEKAQESLQECVEQTLPKDLKDINIYCVCRRGNDSQLAVQLLRDWFPLANVWDVKGGLLAWTAEVDPKFPVY